MSTQVTFLNLGCSLDYQFSPQSHCLHVAVEITVATSAEVVGSVDDLLIQILLPLPVKSLMRFNLVSKDWRSLITMGLFFRGRKFTDFEYIHLGARNQTKGPFRELRFPDDPFPLWIQQSCNGLLLCCSSEKRRSYPIRRCSVYNPTTNSYTKLPRPGVVNEVPRIVCGVYLAFDHAMYPFYKVVCVRDSELAGELFQIEVYSSESGAWRVEEPEEILYFNLDKKTFGTILWPGAVDGSGYPYGRNVGYFGESCDHLHIIVSYDTETAFDVYEMKRDYSEWFVKYRVDRTVVAAAFPQMHYGDFSVFALVRAEEECWFLLLRTPSKVVRVNLDCYTFEEIFHSRDALFRPSLPHAFEYIESLACV
ncbi:F-box protein At5g07610-like [Sesamum indicum]|uniref:F-box protein At5g07610-like n=1 Tax=Sesamum indicum TaxID=4182 RepID=A0A6I9T008_SESIN|nr:F-box protein At5g07610-like [Sesamum indicum]